MKASDRQIEVYVPWDEVIKTRNELPTHSVEYLVLSLYTMIPPARADMNKVKIYKRRKPNPAEIKSDPNYLLVDKNGAMTLVYNEFKSRSRRLQMYKKILPADLTQVIFKSLKEKPRDYLIVSPRTGKPYDNAQTYTTYVDRIFEKIFKKKLTINTLRHSFINSLDLNKMTPEEKIDTANNLMHSVMMMDKYRLIVPAAESPTGNKQVCEVVCKDAQVV
jgi:hypothetical protein